MDCSLASPLSMEFSRQEYWSGFPFPSPGNLPESGIEPGSPALEAESLPTELLEKPQKDKKRDKRLRDGDLSWGGSHEGGTVSKQQETLSLSGLSGVLESQKAT